MGDALLRLVPQPRSVLRGEGFFLLGDTGTACLKGGADDVKPAGDVLRNAWGPGWRQSGARASLPAGRTNLVFRIVSRVAGPQSYRLRIAKDGVCAEAQDRAGLFYAAVTFAQLARLSGGMLPACEIEDAPDFPARGVMLDISRDKVPTMETLFGLVDLLSGLKINQLQLYTEHTFAYRDHSAVWQDASPMTAEEIRTLDVYCAARCVELVPNQNSFGHLERWLTLPRYNVLAELPQGGAPLPWGGVHEKPTSLCPTDPRSADFLAGLYDELLPNFSSRLFNVGCDETFDLRGNGRSQALVREVGEGRVYLEFLKKIHGLVTARGRRMAFWGDIILRHPELVAELPPGVLALEWGYEADHPFDAHGAQFAASGVPFYVCPGTSSWNSLSGRTANMLGNLRSAAEHGLRHGACGYLVTDWGDWGHWQPLCVSYAGFLYGAAVSWCVAGNRDIGLADALDAHLAEGYGKVVLELGDLYRLCGVLRGNGTELFQILSKPRTRPVAAGVTPETLRAVLARVEDTERSTFNAQRATLGQEVEHVIRLLRAACHRGLALLDGGIDCPATRRALAAELDELCAAHRRVWRLRNREGGLNDSLARLLGTRAEYLP
ncbi:MAG: family 20 glycosylhydrolase [Kiritimatiellae bacterium]|nr:family 20 glycosylhydrolase [Kiritimatiellia bacterium]